jgi:hypothetical protein
VSTPSLASWLHSPGIFSPGSSDHGVKSACSVNATAGRPISAARRQVISIDPAGASHDHWLWTWLSGGSVPGPVCGVISVTVDRPGFLRGSDPWEDAESWQHRRSTLTSCVIAR